MREILTHELDLISGGKEAWEAIGDVMRRGQQNSAREALKGPEDAAKHVLENGAIGAGLGGIFGHAFARGAAETAKRWGIVGASGTLGYHIGTAIYNNSDTVSGTAMEAWDIIDNLFFGGSLAD